MIEQAGKAAAAWAEPREKGEVRDSVAEPMADMVKTFSKVTEYWLSDPPRALEAQTRLFSGYHGRLGATPSAASAARRRTPAGEARPRRQALPATPNGAANAFFDFLKQAYLVTSRWAGDLVEHADGLDEHTRHKAGFYVKQISNAISPSNFILTNPELFRETVASNGENLVRGMKMLAEDIAAGKGDLKLRQADYSPLRGRPEHRDDARARWSAAATSPRSSSTTPATETVLKRPLLICPPWINKFYILDLNPQKSFIRWAVEQGHTVFVISWVNPGRAPRRQGLGGLYPRGPAVRRSTRSRRRPARSEVNAIGYCVGGTLLAAALALMAQEGDDRIRSATLFTTQVDFTHAGDLKVFVDEEQIAAVEQLDEREGLSRRHQDGDRLQHAALGRPDLALCRQQLHARQGSPALRPALLERRFDPHGGGQPLLLPAQLLSREQSVAGPDGDRRAQRCRSPTSRSRSTISRPRKTTSRRRARSSSAASYFGGDGRLS